MIEKGEGLKVGCVEGIGYGKGWIWGEKLGEEGEGMVGVEGKGGKKEVKEEE